MNTSKITLLALIAAATVAATIALHATAHASNTYQFQTPSGNIGLGGTPCAGVWPGGQIWLLQQSNELPTLAYGQTDTVGTITCDSEPSGVTCTDSSTGHFFRASREAYELG